MISCLNIIVKMEINDKIYQEAVDVLRIQLSNTCSEMIHMEKYTHQQQWYLEGMIQGLRIGYTIIKDLQHNKVNPVFKVKEKPVEDREKFYQKIIGELENLLK